MSSTFDDLDFGGFENEYTDYEDIRKPFFTVMNGGNEEETLQEWLDNEFEFRVMKSRSRLEEYEEAYCYLSGVQYKSQYSPNRYLVENEYNAKNPKVVDNLIIETIQEKVAKIIRYDPNFVAMPANPEWDDEISAKSAKQMVDTRWYDTKIKKLFARDQFYTFLYGTSFIEVFWDEEDGMIIDESTTERIGDVSYKCISPDRIFPEEEEEWGCVNNLFKVEYECPYELKQQYPNSEFDPDNYDFEDDMDYEIPQSRKYRNKIMKKTFYHRATKNVPIGRKITFISGEILEDIPIDITSYDGKQKLPFNIHIDIEWPNTFWGVSYIRFIKAIQDQYNGLASAAARSFAMASLPKWMVPWGSCDIKTLANGITIVRYKGAREPKLANMNPVGDSLFTQQDRLRTALERKSKIYNIYRRDQKIDLSGIALQFLDEQESEAVSPDIFNRADTVLGVAQLTIDFMHYYYPNTAQFRYKKIFGSDNEYLSEKIDSKIFNTKYTMRLQNAPILPQHKSSRVQMMLEVEQRKPGLVQDEVFLDLLDIADNNKYNELITVSSKSARYENDVMLKGEGIPTPMEYEDHIIHYPLHLKALQERKYKKKLDQLQYESFKKHIKATEFLMWKKAKENPLFRQKLMSIDLFPVFFKVPMDDIQRINAVALGQDPAKVQQDRNNSVKSEFMNAVMDGGTDINTPESMANVTNQDEIQQ